MPTKNFDELILEMIIGGERVEFPPTITEASFIRNDDEEAYLDRFYDDLYAFFDIENVYPNKEKGAYCVLWADGDKTVVRLQDGDTWDEEKAMGLCFMKHLYGSSFNELLKAWCDR